MNLNSLSDALNEAMSQPWVGFVSLKSSEKKNAKNGSAYMRITLSDGKMTVASNIFEDRPSFHPLNVQEWKVGDHFKVQGKASTHPQYGRQIEIQKMRPVESHDAVDGYRPENLLEKAPVDLELFWKEISEAIEELKPEPLRLTVLALFEKHGEAFRGAAAAKQAHHANYGGLMHHTGMMLREAKALLAVPDFPPMNRSLALAGILLHDLAKTVEIEKYPRCEYTEAGMLIGHISIIAGWLDEAAAQVGFGGQELLHLKHILLSHHGELEFGAAALPQTKEALFVHLIDNMDAKMQMVHFAISRLEPHESVTEKLWAFENRAFRKSPQ